jgi:hypothetical protein
MAVEHPCEPDVHVRLGGATRLGITVAASALGGGCSLEGLSPGSLTGRL